MEIPNSNFSRRADNLLKVTQMANGAADTLKPINDDVAELSDRGFAGTLLFNIGQKYADSLTSLDSPGADLPIDINEYRKSKIDGRRIDLGASALGDVYYEHLKSKNNSSLFKHSRMNPEHMTLSRFTTTDDKITGGLQWAFDKRYGELLPDQRRFNSVWSKHEPVLTEIMAEFKKLDEPNSPLGNKLELLPPITPNAFIIRWDVKFSTELATGDSQAAFNNYLTDINNFTDNLLGTMKHSVVDAGDGQNIVIYLPKSVDGNNASSIAEFGKRNINVVISEFTRGQNEIGLAYQDINPQIKIAIALDHVESITETSGNARLSSPWFWLTADMLKNSDEFINYSDEAKQTLLMNGSDRARKK